MMVCPPERYDDVDGRFALSPVRPKDMSVVLRCRRPFR
jgi:hypothetical protein